MIQQNYNIELHEPSQTVVHASRTALMLAHAALADGEWALADSAVRDCDDAACLNIRGVCAEIRGDLKAAKKFYGSSIRADRNFEPAQQNMRRMFERAQFGFSREPFAVGDSLLDLRFATGVRS